MKAFKEKNGTFSWRKAMTLVSVILFAAAVMGYLITHNFNELPPSYTTIIAGVFVFYFGKRLLEGKKLLITDSENEEQDRGVRKEKT